jgi:hypothetical protein
MSEVMFRATVKHYIDGKGSIYTDCATMAEALAWASRFCDAKEVHITMQNKDLVGESQG